MALSTKIRASDGKIYRISLRRGRFDWEVAVREAVDPIPLMPVYLERGMDYPMAHDLFMQIIGNQVQHIIAPDWNN